ncbi:SusC/RagA family TonB-linked outer membrane protein [Flavivirga spongiicola]|uniref:TonB-dependent receptor n=1 Tax=Flavivirga spongiicola TaxID=421621 RepID=A0ABU7XMR8_9FLAO|nr:TonB-dependent receptor [Flavivirga sp. MEBiC05379]MDO5981392.1 TonB-dependent receptor [Flavivirga sp. MEBiC05379]
MKTFIFLFCSAVFSFSTTNTFSQEKVLIDRDKLVSISQVFKIIKQQTNYRFIFPKKAFKDLPKVELKKGEIKLGDLLRKSLANNNLSFVLTENNNILIKKSTVLKDIEKQQEIIVNGIINDINGQPLPGANIVEKGTTNGTQSDFDGIFSLTLGDKDATLIVSFLGYSTQEVLVNSQTNITVTLEEDTASLDEVVVVGYGTQSKRRVTGSISSVDVVKAEKAGFLSTDDVLQGRISGVQIASTSGSPGGQQRINIRGIGSLQGNNLPLIVIDGIPINNSDPSSLNESVFGSVNNQSPLALLNPNDIESIDVLKDAASTAIYGSRGTNGVIIISTKKGKFGKAKVNFSTYSGIQYAPEKIETANTALWLEVNNEARNNFNSDQGFTSGDSGFLAPLSNPLPSGQSEFDWTGGITNSTSTIQDHNLSVFGGNEKTKYYSSFGFFKQEGWFKKSEFKRYSSKLNIEHKFNDKVKFGVNFIGNYSINSRVASHEGGLRLLIRSLEQRPADLPYHPDGSYNIGGSATLTRHSGVQVVNEQDSKYKTYRGIVNAFVEIKPFEGFTYTPSFNIDYGTYHDNTYRSPLHPRGRNVNGQIFDSRNILTNILVENLFNYKKSWEDFDLNVTVGHSYQKEIVESALIDARNFPSPSFRAISSAATQFASGSKAENALDSYLGRLSGTYKNRYFLDVAFRRDGSSRFADGKRYGNFPSVSAGWVLSNEPFFKEDSFISFLKLRGSYGITGSTSSIGNYNSLALVSSGSGNDDSNYLGNSGLISDQLANPNLTWEQASSVNFGLDLYFLEDRVKLTMDYYTRDTDDLLYDRPVHGTTGFTTFSENIGSMTNKGFELGLSTNIINNDSFTWNLDFNVSTASNKLTSLIGDEPIPLGYNVLKIGEPIGSIYLLKQTGIYQSDSDVPAALAANGVRAGDVIYEDVNNDGNITAADRQIVGNAFPDLFGGINNTFKYKDFDLSIFSSFSSGNDIYSAWRSGGFLSGGSAGSIRVGGGVDGLGFSQFGMLRETAQNRWTGSGTSNTIPRAIAGGTGAAFHNNQASSRWIEDGSFFRIKNITLGYTLPKDITDKWSVDNFRLYLTGSNLFTFTKYSGYDPEASDSSDPRTFGADFLTAPPLRTVILGLNLNF